MICHNYSIHDIGKSKCIQRAFQIFKFLGASHSRIEAQFPTDYTDGIIPKSWLLQARDRYDANPQYWDDLAKGDIWRLGLDVGDGQDNLVMESFLIQYCLLVLWGSGNSYCIYSDKIYTQGILLKSPFVDKCLEYMLFLMKN